ncbi:MAG TPA: hypothetical protein VI146_03570 [Nitrososphaeraceae archaeon]
MCSFLHRKWLENKDLNLFYCDFPEGYSSFAVESAKELVVIIKSDQDTAKIIRKAGGIQIIHGQMCYIYKCVHVRSLI